MNINELKIKIIEGFEPSYHLFYVGECSQWLESYFEIGYTRYSSCEQYMMAQKAVTFEDYDSYRKIMSARSPKVIKALGKMVKKFVPKVWDDVKYQIVVDGNYAKFSQNEELLEFLLNTGDDVMVEASPYDTIWGIGMGANHSDATNPNKWQGENLLGFAIMDVREQLLKLDKV